MKRLDKATVAFAAILLVFGLYAGAYIRRTSLVVDGQRYYSLFDDAMVSMRYARNLAHGYGLVWNPGGERVEGYTNPLWVLYMALFHLLPVAPPQISLFIQVSALLFLLANLFFVKKIADLLSGGSPLASLPAVVLTAFYLPLITWSLQGMEVCVLAPMLSAATWVALLTVRSGKLRPWLYVLLGVGTLVRLDMAVPYVAILAYLALVDRENRGRHLLIGLGVLAAFVLGQTALRLWYYGDPLPNTYYLKMTGYPLAMRLTRGLSVTAGLAGSLGWILLVAGLGTQAFRRDRGLPLLLWLFLAQAAYSIYVGGDAWEWWGGANRYTAFAVPLLFLSFSCITARVGLLLAGKIGAQAGLAYAQAGLVGLAFLGLIGFRSGDSQHLDEWLLLRPPLHMVGNKAVVTMARVLDDVTRPEARIGVVWAGALPYFADREAVDMLGKSDRYIAHLPMRVPTDDENKYTEFYPGHLKWDYGYSIGRLKPDVVVQLWQRPEEATPYLERDYLKVTLRGYDMYLLKRSPNILWDRVAEGT